MFGNLEYYYLRDNKRYWGESNGFSYLTEYLQIETKNGKVLMLNGSRELIPIEIEEFSLFFFPSKTIAPIETQVYIGNDYSVSCKKGTSYSIYKKQITSKGKQEYYIMDDQYKLCYLPSDYFALREDLREQLKNKNLEKTEEEKHMEFLEKCFTFLKTPVLGEKIKKKSWLRRLFFRNTSEQNFLVEYEKVKQYNQLPYTILGKIKYIENEILLLEYQEYSKEIINVLKKNINLTLLIAFQEDNETIDNSNIIEKIESYLDTTIEYINSLKLNKQLFNKEIELKVVDDIIGIIDDNEAVLKDLIKLNSGQNSSQ